MGYYCCCPSSGTTIRFSCIWTFWKITFIIGLLSINQVISRKLFLFLTSWNSTVVFEVEKWQQIGHFEYLENLNIWKMWLFKLVYNNLLSYRCCPSTEITIQVVIHLKIWKRLFFKDDLSQSVRLFQESHFPPYYLIVYRCSSSWGITI